ncbi:MULTISPECIES: tRNA glutamyl-Q(34) synthetase GluQRS [Thiorhodovibrio]|uniref:tRNA glutamyl-Q(34) synthetase GluQRS n=1 Tax=Thiorhodovibrio TaxID=61593 RepID=UPI0019128445|nr:MULTISPECIES: tRNA glutamyl-Q(34) synthetase GluQRS [Thiorhodovibrio]MBK5969799.1 tRNA glutamyl-Q(34) synthetase GluQRS [Thiorhodovibrio winogradskyi]WPL12157.1 Glutamyl-Q tRNA(Asp) synthetase [Thiorhodovibrio litoralis]
MADPAAYRGRFAPSPTGPLHFGSLVAALGSFLDARAAGGEWLVRMEDLDRTREVPGAAASILRTLERLGLHWDGSVDYQHQRLPLYRDALADLTQRGLAYSCSCSRKMIAATARVGSDGPIYPGTCRDGLKPGAKARTQRFRVPPGEVSIIDRIRGRVSLDVNAALGDFVLHRADGIPAYQLAVVVDDAAQGVNHVVRGADLLLCTLRQRLLQQALDLPAIEYAHLPLALDSQGRKLSKSASDTPLETADPLASLSPAWAFLGQTQLPGEIDQLEDFWAFAIRHWSPERVPTGSAPASSARHEEHVK